MLKENELKIDLTVEVMSKMRKAVSSGGLVAKNSLGTFNDLAHCVCLALKNLRKGNEDISRKVGKFPEW